MAPYKLSRSRKKGGKGYGRGRKGFSSRFREKWDRTKAVRRRAIGSRRLLRNPFNSRATKAIKQIALGNESPLAFMGISKRNYMVPMCTLASNNPYTPVTLWNGVVNLSCFGSFTPNFARGTDDEEPQVNTGTANLPPDSTNDRFGDEISGDTIYIKGYRLKFVGAMTSKDVNYPNTPPIQDPPSDDDNFYRIILCQVNQNQSQNTDTMVNTDWAKIWRCDQLPDYNDGDPVIEGNGPLLMNTMMAYRDRDELNNYKFVRDTKWKEMQVNHRQGSNRYHPVEHDFYIPVNRRFIIQENGSVVGFNEMNWAILGTWPSANYQNAPTFRMRIDLYYKDGG